MTNKKITIDGTEYDLVPSKTSNLVKVHAGFNCITGKEIICADRDAYRLMTYNQAEEWVKTLEKGWRLPYVPELLAIYFNKDKIGGFKTEYSGLEFGCWYWSCSEHWKDTTGVGNVRFSDGDVSWGSKDNCQLSVRPVWEE